MAKRSKRSSGPVRVIEKSLKDAQKVLASYISSGSDQVTDTIRTLRRIFDNRQLAAALKKARAARQEVAGAVGGSRTKQASARTSARRKSKTRTSKIRAPAKRRVKTSRPAGRRAKG